MICSPLKLPQFPLSANPVKNTFSFSIHLNHPVTWQEPFELSISQRQPLSRPEFLQLFEVWISEISQPGKGPWPVRTGEERGTLKATCSSYLQQNALHFKALRFDTKIMRDKEKPLTFRFCFVQGYFVSVLLKPQKPLKNLHYNYKTNLHRMNFNRSNHCNQITSRWRFSTCLPF